MKYRERRINNFLLQTPLQFSLLICLSLMTLASHARTVTTPVARYTLECSDTFSCPASLIPRVSFWVEVFSRWDTDTAIFHDKDNPHRVYSTIKRKQGCRHSRNGDSIDRERRRLKSVLKMISKKLDAGKALSKSQTEIYSLFAGEGNSELNRASERIRCQSGNKDRMQEALANFQIYRPTILDALEKQNLTPELQYLPFVESAFNPEALSHVGAAGLWQIMPATGRSLGLVVNSSVDERYDPRRATYAAAKYFRNSVDDLTQTAIENGSSVTAKNLNPFVITSYNYGVKGMIRAINQVGLDYERLLTEYKSPSFQTAVKNFYASFLAARHVAKNKQHFFGDIESNTGDHIFSYNIVTLSRGTSAKRIVKELNIDEDVIKKLNPALKRVVWRDKALIPQGYRLKLPYKETGWNEAFVALNKLPAEVERPGYIWHKVSKGQTACGIAERYRASCRALRNLNKLNKKATIYVGQRLKVPTKSGGISVVGSNISSSTSSTTTYRVRAGDFPCNIARKHSMTCNEFLALNGLTRKSIIRVGQKVKVSSINSWHTVTKGQTACGIAENYGVKCSVLLNANRLSRSSTIRIGQRIRIPSRS